MFSLPNTLILLLNVLVKITLAQDAVTTTVIDILSEKVEFSYFLRMLQRNQLIPYLNEQIDITLLAPVNSAFFSDSCQELSCLDGSHEILDVSSLNTYIVHEPFTSSSFDGYHILKTAATDEETQSNLIPHPILTYTDPSSGVFKINHIDVVEIDLYANTQNSYVQGLEKTFNHIKSTRETIESIPNTGILSKLLDDKDLSNNTMLIPLDSAFEFEEYELNYLLSGYGHQDRGIIIDSLLVNDYHGGNINDSFADGNGYSISLASNDKGQSIIVNNTITSTEANILAIDSLFHIFSDPLLIQNIEFNAEKTLIGLNATPFVEELILQDLEYLITNNTLEQTIFYAQDSNPFSIQSKSSNLYHFIPERVDDLSKSKPLYDTKFCNSKRLESCQRIKIESIGGDTFMLNNNVLVQSGPYRVGNSVIYLTDDNVRTPGDIMSSVNPAYHCSKSINYLSQVKLHKLPNNKKGYTLFLPCFDSHDDYSLTFNYLERNRTALELVMRNFIVEGTFYTDFKRERIELSNLNGDLIVLDHIFGDDRDLTFDFNHEEVRIRTNGDILFNQGVIQPTNEFLFPSHLEITLNDIISASDSDKFLNFFKFFQDLNQILNSEPNHSILMPSSLSLSRLDPFKSMKALENFLKLHIIPSASLESLYNCEDDIQTLNPKVNLTCSKISKKGDFVVRVKNGADTGARVLSKGCTSSSKRSCIYSVDTPINPEWISDHYHLSLPGIALAVGILLGSVSMVIFLLCGMLIVLKKNKGKVDPENIDRHQVDENTPLIREVADTPAPSSNSPSFEQGYSGNSNVEAINFTKKKVSFLNRD